MDDNWQKVREIFDLALYRKGDERRKFIIEACGEDKSLLQAVESLLASADETKSFLENPAAREFAEAIVGDRQTKRINDNLGHYKIIKQIGAGGMGEVYLARDKKLDRNVAVKILNEQFSKHESNLQRFIREAKSASALNHPNILVVHEVGESNNSHYIVSEYVKGKTLREFLKNDSIRVSEILDIAVQIANALAAAHEAHLIHRDIKPENIIIRPDGFVKILDFGLAKIVKRDENSFLNAKNSTAGQTAEGVILGTVNYMSPEQAKGERVDERTDIFSFGVVIYEMISDRTPFAGDSPSETFANLINQEPPPLSDVAGNIPEGIERIVMKMLDKNKDERYLSMKGLLADLMELREIIAFDERIEKLSSQGSKTNAEKKTTKVLQAKTDDLEKQTDETRHNFSGQIERRKSFAAATALIVFLIAGIVAGLWYAKIQIHESNVPLLAAPFASEMLSTNGKVFHAVISPDGKNVIYTKGINGKESIWLRQLESVSNVEVIPASYDIYYGLAFSPDGNFLYFVRRPDQAGTSASVYRVSIFGGIPQKIISETEGWISISPDGAKISFVRCFYQEHGSCSLMIADAVNGKNEKTLVSRQYPVRIGDNEFAPDGKRIAFAAGQSENMASGFGLMEIDLETGAERELTPEKFSGIKSLTWLPGGENALLFIARKINERNFRIRRLSLDSGDIEPLTKDSEIYTGLSLDKTASNLVSTQVKRETHLLLFQMENPSPGQILADAGEAAFAPDGKILFSSEMTGSQEIWSVSPDGSGQRQLTNDAANDTTPIVSLDSNSIFFASNRTGEAQVWRMNTDGGNQVQLTQKEGGFPLVVSPDGRWLYYCHGLDRTLWRVPTDGGLEQLVLNKGNYPITFSPDGARAAFFQKQGAEENITIVSLSDGKTLKIFSAANLKAQTIDLAWSMNGKNLIYILRNRENENNIMWLQPLEGGQPKQIADLGTQEIWHFALSPDGKSFIVTQGDWKHDAVLLKGLK